MSFNLSGDVLVMVPTLNEELGIKKVLEDMPKGSVVLVVDGKTVTAFLQGSLGLRYVS